MYRTHHCSELRISDLDREVTLAGWVDSARDHGGVIFIDLRDREGRTQVVFRPEESPEAAAIAHTLRNEDVVQVTGKVTPRVEGTQNPKLATGAIEVVASSLTILNRSEILPFPLDSEVGNEDLRLTHRYLDLRRPSLVRNLKARHLLAKVTRDYLDRNGYLEIETPILSKSTPEGAREFLVPSRLIPNHYYALSQSPQQYKQLLMVGGIERYFQIAKCFRDEDPRADRITELTQIDLEASFIEREDIVRLIEGLLKEIFRATRGIEIQTPFLRLSYREAMDRFGVDKPDLRFGPELVDLSALFHGSQFKVFRSAIDNGGVVKCINAKGLAKITTGQIEDLTNLAKESGAKGLAFIKVEGGEWKSPIVKFLSEAERSALAQQLAIAEGDTVFFAAAPWEKACAILGRIRLDAAALLQKRGKLSIRPDDWKFLWVVDFPLMTYDEEKKSYVATHHPFTAPVAEDAGLIDTDPKAVRGQHYDIVLNGMELGGGSIRIHQPALQKKIFEDVLKIPADVVENRFGYMLRAFTYGAPPHGGIAFGLDRIVALLCGTTSIRDVIAFPKTQKGQDLMAGSPTPVTPKQLTELHIAVVAPEQPLA